MYKYIVSSLIIVILLVVYFILLSKGVAQIQEGFFSERFSEGACRDCNRIGKKGMNQCLSCNNCGWCIDPNGYGSCVLGNSDGPLFAECAQYMYNGGIPIATGNPYIGNTFFNDNQPYESARRWRAIGNIR
jgi:hypothetical protein